ncbi:MAG: LpxL/LpxP family Kdo(2)-lipid IV(A) lauroyl/palmitoleoyl acyltransferase [Gammaproteobacteria bacterium]
MTDSHLFHPRYWPTWLGLGLMWCLAQLPFAWQLGIGRAIGTLLERVSPRRRHIAAVNLALCFPDSTEAERRALLHGHFQSLGIGVVETAMSWWTPEHRLREHARIEGLEHLQRAHDAGKGVILLSGHFTTLEIGGRLLALHAPFHVHYREHKNPVFDAVMKRAREARFEKAIPRGNMRAMVRSLKDNTAVWYAPDQNYGAEHSVFVPFFGVPAATITATSRLARMTGAAVVPFFQERLPDTQGYRLTLLPALEDFPTGDDDADARRVNAIIEEAILRAPAQYLWTHRRFKTRPPGAASVYENAAGAASTR